MAHSNRQDQINATAQTAKRAGSARPAALAGVAALMAAAAVLAPAAFGSQEAAATSRSSAAMITGRHWLNGRGVDVLRGRQCVELATRLYGRNHWGSLNNIYGLRSGRLYDHKIRFHRNGSGYVPVPGDVLVELGGSYQHVAVVNRVTRKAIFTVEQNAVPSGRHTYSWNGRTARGAYGPRHVGGFIHSSRNRLSIPIAKPAPAAPVLAAAV